MQGPQGTPNSFVDDVRGLSHLKKSPCGIKLKISNFVTVLSIKTIFFLTAQRVGITVLTHSQC